MKNIFLEKSYTKCGGETIPRPFSKKLKVSISLDQYSTVLYSFFFLLYFKYRKILKPSSRPLVFTSNKVFLKMKMGLEPFSLPHFLHGFSIKIFPLLYFTN